MLIVALSSQGEFADFWSSVLQGSDLRLVPTASEQEALQIARGLPIDACVVDLETGDLDALTFCRRWAQEAEALPVPVFLACRDEPDPVDREAFLQSGVEGFLRWPADPANLLQSIHSAVRKHTIASRDAMPAAVVAAVELRDRAVPVHRLQHVFDHQSHIVLVLDAGSGSVIDHNDQATVLLDCQSEWLLGRTFMDLHPKDQRPRAKNLFVLTRDRGHATSENAKLQARTGGSIEVQVSGQKVIGPAGAEVIMVCRDIRSWRGVERALRQRSNELSVINRVSTAISLSLEPDRVMEDTVKQLVEVAGMDIGAIYLLDNRRGFLELAAGVGVPEGRAARQLSLGEGIGGFVCLTGEAVSWEQGQPNPYARDPFIEAGVNLVMGVPIRAKGKVVGVIAVARRRYRAETTLDVQLMTAVGNQIGVALENARLFEDRARAYQQLKTSQLSLIQAEKTASLGMLSAGVVNELANPAALLLANLGVLRDYGRRALSAANRAMSVLESTTGAEEGRSIAETTGLSEVSQELPDLIEDCLTAVNRIRGLAAELRSVSGVGTKQDRATDVNQVIRSAIALTSARVSGTAQLVRKLGQVPTMHLDPGHLAQVVMNLVIHAALSIPEGDAEGNSIEVSSRLSRGNLVIDVEDTGEGLADDQIEQAFEPFSGEETPGEAARMGLSLAQDLVRRMGGRISLESTLGRGSRVEVIIPARLDIHDVEVLLPPDQGRTLEKGSVLIVDDDPDLLRSLKRVLSSRYEVHLAEGAAQGLEYIRQAKADYSFVLCDLSLKGSSGMDIHSEASHLVPRLAPRFVFLTGEVYARRAQEFVRRHADQVITKPVAGENLIRFLEERAKRLSAWLSS